MVEALVRQDVVYGTHRPGFGISGPDHEAADPDPDQGPGAHQTGLEGHIQAVILQVLDF